MMVTLRILLPFAFTIPVGDAELEPVMLEQQGSQIAFHPPYRSRIDYSLLRPDSEAPVVALVEQLDPAPTPLAIGSILINQQKTVQADVLHIDLLHAAGDRTLSVDDPLVGVGFAVANRFLAAQRCLSRAEHIKPVDQDSTIWRLEYLNDDGSPLRPEPGLARVKCSINWTLRACILDGALWSSSAELLQSGFEATASDTLLLDASSLLPETGPAVVLAYSAIETRIEIALNSLAHEIGFNADMWEWINERGADYRKQPSVAEQLDALLKGLVGHSLKERNDLWQAFVNLREARNNFVHRGSLMMRNTPLTPRDASELIAGARAIIDWIESLLPPSQRRPTYTGTTSLSIRKLLVGEAAGEPPAAMQLSVRGKPGEREEWLPPGSAPTAEG